MKDPRDKSYLEKVGILSSDKRTEDILQRRGEVKKILALLPASYINMPDDQLETLDPKIKKTLMDIEKLSETWSYDLGDGKHLGREFDENTAQIWQCSRATGAFLNMMIRLQKPKHILELGTSVGYSTLWMADACKKVGGHISTIEYLEAKVRLAQTYFVECNVDDVINLVQGDIAKVLESWTGEGPDLVFMDPNKEWQNYYLGLLKKIMLPGSVIITDNAFDSHDIAEEYVESLSPDFSSLFLTLDQAGTILSVKN